VARNLDRLSLSLVLKLAEFALKFQGARLNHGGLSHWDIQLVLSRFLSLRWAGLLPRGRWFVGLGASGAPEGPAGRESRIVIGTEKTSQCAFTNDKSPRSSSPASLPCRVIDEARFQRRLNKFFLTPDIISMKDNFVSGTVVTEPPLATTGVLTDGGW
jgi:hypothetical protein